MGERVSRCNLYILKCFTLHVMMKLMVHLTTKLDCWSFFLCLEEPTSKEFKRLVLVSLFEFFSLLSLNSNCFYNILSLFK